ncbi:glutaminyl-peptide cyclotransferase [Actinophytocola oryzae]|uniref:Glutamine cyclotransferase n=1 Tax=Actinophytocola oryzae TaxID=502181 RepID=A0A4R7UY59_9PSEU|nr:glutaminyl-peptide cyclotransferase [Actinophytocola oryzae]TDV41828.1 glutamine cyclotransferase [Actinophytocola oryzae]
MRAPLVVAIILLLAGCSAASTGNPPTTRPSGTLKVDVLRSIPHDPEAFTQGFELVDGVLYEGTGLEGKSSIRTVDPDTGAVRKKVDLPADLFGEGITVAGDTIWQITWQNGIAIKRDRTTLAEKGRVDYDGEGWGLCHDPGADRLIMSDGSDHLTFRDVDTFRAEGGVDVRDEHGDPLLNINELECVPDQDGHVYVLANVWQTDEIVGIDPASGRVTTTIDLSGLLPEKDQAGADVLNGIAHIPGTEEFLVTGKLWPKMFRVRFVTSGS